MTGAESTTRSDPPQGAPGPGPATAPGPLGTRPSRPRKNDIILVAAGTALVLIGLIVFTQFQTQPLFRFAQATDTLHQRIPRQNGMMLLGALMAMTGLTLTLQRFSRLPGWHRVLPGLVFGACGTTILIMHYSIFTNGWVIPDSRFVTMEASLLFHDTAETIAIATFLLSFVTFLVLAAGAIAMMRLIVPLMLRQHIVHPKNLHASRARLGVVTLLLLGAGAQLVRWFFQFAVTADANPSGHFLTTNLIGVYYLKAVLLALVLGLMTWRTTLLLWGRLDDRLSARARRKHSWTVRLETWIWGALLALTFVVLNTGPLYTPSDNADRVFAVNSRGVTWFLLVLGGLYLLQRRFTKTHHANMRRLRRPLPSVGPDRLLVAMAGGVVIWSLAWIPGVLWDLSPLVSLTIRTIPLVILFIALGFQAPGNNTRTPPPDASAAPVLFLTGMLLSILVGIMLWGSGNTVTVLFSQASGGFLSEEGRLLQPYSTGIRLLGALFIIVPVLLALWMLVERRRNSASPGPFILSGLSFLLTINLLFTIDPGSRFDHDLGRTDVLIGFWAYVLSTPFDVSVMIGIWAVSTTIGIGSVLFLVERGRDARVPPLKPPPRLVFPIRF